MQYVIAFLEGIITFISPCLLPMLPIYISYFAGGGERTTSKTLKGALGFVIGFTVVFVILGALAGTVGGFLKEHQTAVNIVSGLIVIFANFSNIPSAIALIMKEAFNPTAVSCGFFGVLIIGLRRSVQSNEAGTGAAVKGAAGLILKMKSTLNIMMRNGEGFLQRMTGFMSF